MNPATKQQIFRRYKIADFVCPCCNYMRTGARFFTHILMFEELQDILGFEIEVINAYMCQKRIKEIGKNPKTEHNNFATDVRPKYKRTGMELGLLYMAAIEIGFTGVGLYDDHVHIDLRPHPLKWKV